MAVWTAGAMVVKWVGAMVGMSAVKKAVEKVVELAARLVGGKVCTKAVA